MRTGRCRAGRTRSSRACRTIGPRIWANWLGNGIADWPGPAGQRDHRVLGFADRGAVAAHRQRDRARDRSARVDRHRQVAAGDVRSCPAQGFHSIWACAAVDRQRRARSGRQECARECPGRSSHQSESSGPSAGLVRPRPCAQSLARQRLLSTWPVWRGTRTRVRTVGSCQWPTRNNRRARRPCRDRPLLPRGPLRLAAVLLRADPARPCHAASWSARPRPSRRASAWRT